MPMTYSREPLMIPYGTGNWSLGELARLSGEPVLKPAFPVAAIPISGDEGFRLYHYDMGEAPSAQAADADDIFSAIRYSLCGHVGTWDKATRRFIELYLDAVQAIIARDAALIESTQPTYAGLYSAIDWSWSAPCPLPRAFLPVRSEPESEEDFVQVDTAFWTGDGFVAMETGGIQLLPNRAAARRERLQAAGIALLLFPPAAPADWDALIGKLLPDGRKRFWEGPRLPQGPRRNRAIDLLDRFVGSR